MTEQAKNLKRKCVDSSDKIDNFRYIIGWFFSSEIGFSEKKVVIEHNVLGTFNKNDKIHVQIH
jgi:hypothetical protein